MVAAGLHPTDTVRGGIRSAAQAAGSDGHRLHPFEAAIPGGREGVGGVGGGGSSSLLTWIGAGGTGLILWGLLPGPSTCERLFVG